MEQVSVEERKMTRKDSRGKTIKRESTLHNRKKMRVGVKIGTYKRDRQRWKQPGIKNAHRADKLR